jgi:hypothetical protein
VVLPPSVRSSGVWRLKQSSSSNLQSSSPNPVSTPNLDAMTPPRLQRPQEQQGTRSVQAAAHTPPLTSRVILPEPPVTGSKEVLPIEHEGKRYYSYSWDDAIEDYIQCGLQRCNKEQNNLEAVQEVVFQLITRARLTDKVSTMFRNAEYPQFITF